MNNCEGFACNGKAYGTVKGIKIKIGRNQYQGHIIFLCQQCRNFDMGKFRLASKQELLDYESGKK